MEKSKRSDLKTVFREQFTPFVKLLFPNESLLGTGIQQYFSGVERNECPGSAEKGLRSVGCATVMNRLEFSSSLVAF